MGQRVMLGGAGGGCPQTQSCPVQSLCNWEEARDLV